jgi:hypothetical protein
MTILKYGERCPECGAPQVYETNKRCSKCRIEFVDAPPPPPPPPPGSTTYKVLTQRDEWFMGKFSPEKLEEAVNAYAAEGWRVISVATADVGSFFGSLAGNGRQEIVVFMEKHW